MIYNIKFKPHKRTSILLDNIGSVVVEAKNKSSAKELGYSIVRDYYDSKGLKNGHYMARQYSYIIEKE